MFYVLLAIVSGLFHGTFQDKKDAPRDETDTPDEYGLPSGLPSEESPPAYSGIRGPDGIYPPVPENGSGNKPTTFLTESPSRFYQLIPGVDNSSPEMKCNPRPQEIFRNSNWNFPRGLRLMSEGDIRSSLEECRIAQKEYKARVAETQGYENEYSDMTNEFEEFCRKGTSPQIYKRSCISMIVGSICVDIFCEKLGISIVRSEIIGLFTGIIMFYVPILREYQHARKSKENACRRVETSQEQEYIANHKMDEKNRLICQDIALHFLEMCIRGYAIPKDLPMMIPSLIPSQGIELALNNLNKIERFFQTMGLTHAIEESKNMVGLLKNAASSKNCSVFPLYHNMLLYPLLKTFNGMSLNIQHGEIYNVYIAVLLIDDNFNKNPLLYINALIKACIMYKNLSLVEWLYTVGFLPQENYEAILLHTLSS